MTERKPVGARIVQRLKTFADALEKGTYDRRMEARCIAAYERGERTTLRQAIEELQGEITFYDSDGAPIVTVPAQGPWPYTGYGDDMIPTWCGMPTADHRAANGCWGISSGAQPAQGEDYCRVCELHTAQEPT